MDSELPDNKLIREGKSPLPAWLYLALIAVAAMLIWGGGSWFYNKKLSLQETRPFLQVTNRQFSLFLWQFPEYMRANVSSKSGYLPGFQYGDKIAIEPGKAEEFVQAPPQVLFLYHTWNRLISDEFAPRIITNKEFHQFLDYCQEWKPQNWKEAPQEYKTLVESLDKLGDKELPLISIPKEVQIAFIGWKNYFFEGALINLIKPTYGEMDEFIKKYPHYARNYWQNIVKNGKPDYLKIQFSGKGESKAEMPDSELAAFLKVAFFNYVQSKKKL